MEGEWMARPFTELFSRTQSSASFLLSVLSPPFSPLLSSLPPCWGKICVSCDCWDCDSAEPDKTRQDLSPLSCSISEECPNFPVETCIIQVQNPAVTTGQITLWSWLILFVITSKHPQAWSESQKNLTDFTCLGHKKTQLRNAAFLLSHLWQRGFTPPPRYNSHFWWFNVSFFEQLSVSQTRAIVQEWKGTPNLMYLFWLRVLAPALSSIRIKLNRHSTNEPDSLQFFSLRSIWRLRLEAPLILVQYTSLSDQLLSLQE